MACAIFLLVACTLPRAAVAEGIWYKLCFDQTTGREGDPKDAKVNVCLTQVDVRDNVTAVVKAKFALRQIQGQDKPQLVVMLPLRSAIAQGAFAQIDDEKPFKLSYTSCDQAGCYAEVTVDPSVVSQLKSAKEIYFGGMDTTGKWLKIPLPLESFPKAFDGAPVPLAKYNDDQRKSAEMIKQRQKSSEKQP
jgi:invasion protein IalB